MKKRIFIFDSDKATRIIIAKYLSDYDLVIASSFIDAINILTHNPAFNAYIIDAFSAASNLTCNLFAKEVDPNKTILISSLETNEMNQHLRNLNRLMKPYTKTQLEIKLNAIFRYEREYQTTD